MTEIRLTGLRVRGRHGVLPEERTLGQEFVVDVTVTVADPPDDDVGQTVDYGQLAQRLADVVAGEPVALLETLAGRLLDVCLDERRALRAKVTVHKPAAPIPLPFDDVAVTVERRRLEAAVVALGSNVGDRLAHLQAAVDLLQPRAVSPVYETEPVGGPEQGPYLNAVALLSPRDVRALLRLAQAIERCRGRERGERWGPRTLDVDLIEVGHPVDEPDLTLPHPRAHERAFVLVPWLDVQPDAVLTGHGPVTELVDRLDTSGVRRTDHVLHLPQ